MVLSGILLKLPYTLAWHVVKALNMCPRLVFYCAELMDWHCFQPLMKLLPDTIIASPNKMLRQYLRKQGLQVIAPPVFPRAVIMCRHATHHFPCTSILKIGMRHGPYHFKRMTKAANYDQFDLYLFSSPADLAAAQEIGVRKGKVAGFPRLDPALDGSITLDDLRKLGQELKLDPAKPSLLFTATWDGSGMSAISKWYNRLITLTQSYNILVTTHPWTKAEYIAVLKHTPGVLFLENRDLLPCIMLADICVGDQSSLLAECSALNKPIISFRTPDAKRSLPEIDALMDLISLRVNSFDELIPALRKLENEPELLATGRAKANAIMFDILDGIAAHRAADLINKLMQDRYI